MNNSNQKEKIKRPLKILARTKIKQRWKAKMIG
jgi:hypothetical protein